MQLWGTMDGVFYERLWEDGRSWDLANAFLEWNNVQSGRKRELESRHLCQEDSYYAHPMIVHNFYILCSLSAA